MEGENWFLALAEPEEREGVGMIGQSWKVRKMMGMKQQKNDDETVNIEEEDPERQKTKW